MPSNNRDQSDRNKRGQFAPGNPGGPGRKAGSRNRVSLAVDSLLDGEAEALTRKAVEMAKDGDTTALRLCLERLCPPRKDRPVQVEMPEMGKAEDAAQAAGAILQAVAAGQLTPSEGQAMAGLVETYRRTLETEDIERRLAALEQARTR